MKVVFLQDVPNVAKAGDMEETWVFFLLKQKM